MDKIVQLRPAATMPTEQTWRDGLWSLAFRMGEAKSRSENDSSLSLLRKGDPDFTRRALENIVSGPVVANPRDFAEVLGRLSLHYHRPDLTPAQAAAFNADYVMDLNGVTRAELEAACAQWRKGADNRFYPTTGQLWALVKDKVAERKRAARGAEYLLSLIQTPALSEQALPHDVMRRRWADLAAKMRVGTVVTDER